MRRRKTCCPGYWAAEYISAGSSPERTRRIAGSPLPGKRTWRWCSLACNTAHRLRPRSRAGGQQTRKVGAAYRGRNGVSPGVCGDEGAREVEQVAQPVLVRGNRYLAGVDTLGRARSLVVAEAI